MSNLYHVGKIVNTHGIKGELKVVPITDFPAERFAKGSPLVVEGTPNTPVTIASARPQKGLYLLTFKGYADINAVLPFKGQMLSVREEDQQALAEDEYYYHDIIGLTIIDQDDQVLGQVSEILTPGPNDVWVIPRVGKADILLPFLNSVVQSIDLATKTARVDVPEGLIDDAD
ncbi:ribosome maturation factor RimM [Lacticaseibacillus daqingensis]|uniref:ribosome maturation factor RimM n=1 Tax=Lacticaseibacillus daqingensis TaxID=2486014 RepID=UPI000F7B6A17|nr:ribosome maturation factor RimM [Lacticaseibacillus daqingensis]